MGAGFNTVLLPFPYRLAAGGGVTPYWAYVSSYNVGDQDSTDVFFRGEAVTGYTFAPINKSNGQAITSGSVTCYLTLDGGTQATSTNTAVHEGNGQWSIDFTAAEMTADVISILFTHASAWLLHIPIITRNKETHY